MVFYLVIYIRRIQIQLIFHNVNCNLYLIIFIVVVNQNIRIAVQLPVKDLCSQFYTKNDSPENTLGEGFDLAQNNSLIKYLRYHNAFVKSRKVVDQQQMLENFHRIYQIIGDKTSYYLFYQSKG
ncbi:unnamed protein product [Paramecium octaurelia]|uniref:Uncharacterized protein n=1 Tax=Paramecium octaurelia TaxID=43137 RepID=A0A8S1WHX5_PAROT|nr:unnamed protein product [Paramecium octaurelia]